MGELNDNILLLINIVISIDVKDFVDELILNIVLGVMGNCLLIFLILNFLVKMILLFFIMVSVSFGMWFCFCVFLICLVSCLSFVLSVVSFVLLFWLVRGSVVLLR